MLSVISESMRARGPAFDLATLLYLKRNEENWADLRWRQCLINAVLFCYSHRMSSNLDQLTADAMKLPLRDRVQLAQRLVSTIDDGEYFAALLQEQQKVRSEEKLEGMLAEGLSTESSALNEKDWQHARAELENRITQSK